MAAILKNPLYDRMHRFWQWHFIRMYLYHKNASDMQSHHFNPKVTIRSHIRLNDYRIHCLSFSLLQERMELIDQQYKADKAKLQKIRLLLVRNLFSFKQCTLFFIKNNIRIVRLKSPKQEQYAGFSLTQNIAYFTQKINLGSKKWNAMRPWDAQDWQDITV